MADSSSSEDGELLAVAAALLVEEKPDEHQRKSRSRSRPRKKRSVWVRPWIQRRKQIGAYTSLLQELASEDSPTCRSFLRMSMDNFDTLLTRVRPHIQKQDTQMRESIPPGERLALTLRYLASGNKFRDLQFLYRIPPCTVSKIVHETCSAIYNVLVQDCLKTPQSEEEWFKIAEGFEKRWNYPHCIGALDGKHIAIRAPPGEGSSFFNYKHFHSIILLALVDSNYKFVYVDVGANGRAGDAGVFADSALFRGLENNSLHIPCSRPLPNSGEGNSNNIPYVIVGDDAFPLKKYLMKPYPERHDASQSQTDIMERKIHNYRLSRARRCAENAFGILVQRFAVFQSVIHLSPEKATNVTLAALALHNFLMKEKDVRYMTTDQIPAVSDSLRSIQAQRGNRNSTEARQVRDAFSNYFNGVGSVPWQSNI